MEELWITNRRLCIATESWPHNLANTFQPSLRIIVDPCVVVDSSKQAPLTGLIIRTPPHVHANYLAADSIFW